MSVDDGQNACCSVQLGNKGNYLLKLKLHFLMFLESFFIVRSTCFGHHSVHHQEHYCSLCSPVKQWCGKTPTKIARNKHTKTKNLWLHKLQQCSWRWTLWYPKHVERTTKKFPRTLESVQSVGINNYLSYDGQNIRIGWFGLPVVVYHPLSVNNVYVSGPSENWQMDWQSEKQAPRSVAAGHNITFTRPATTFRLFIFVMTQHFALSCLCVGLPSQENQN
jgi:hypothetical protein